MISGIRFLAFTSEAILTDRLVEIFKDIPAEEVRAAAHKGWEELAAARRDIEKKGEETLKYIEENHRRGIVLAGRPYHIDPEDPSRHPRISSTATASPSSPRTPYPT